MTRSSAAGHKDADTGDKSAQIASVDNSTFVNLYTLLIQKKWLLISVSVAPPIIAGIFLFVTQPVFESRAVVQIGEAVQTIEPPDLVAERLREIYGGQDGMNGVSRPVLYDIKTSRAAKSVMSIIAHGTDPAATREFLKTITEKLLTEHRAIMDVVQDRVRLRLAVVDRQIGELRERTAVLTREARAAKNGGLVAALVLEKSRVQGRLDDLEQERVKFDVELQSYALKSTRLLREADLPNSPVAPNGRLILLLSLVLGTIFCAMAILFSEHCQRTKKSHSDTTKRE